MKIASRTLPLAGQNGFRPLFRDYLVGVPGGPVRGATREWNDFIAGDSGRGPAPAWTNSAWVESWWRDLQADMPDAASSDLAAANLDALRNGAAEVVITGQQPGFLGGPLYTLYKAAAAVAAARLRTAAGRPTVPLFWSGDDDDDRQEAFEARIWDFRRGGFLQPIPPTGASDVMVGAAPAAQWAAPGAAWLSGMSGAGDLAADLAAVWSDGVASDSSWARLLRRALLRLLRGSGLLVVSGNDSGLHAMAEPLYRMHAGRRDELAALAAARGEELIAAGGHAQLSATALERTLNREDGGRRLRLSDAEAATVPAASLRPGVALRPLVQDWLFQPAGVVVGPGEIAYLEQLRPVYPALAIRRSPLLPRLFARLTTDPDRSAAGGGAAGDRDGTARSAADSAAARIIPAVRDCLDRALAAQDGVDAAAAAELADRLAGRWRAEIASGLARIARDSAGNAAAAESPWEAPPGARQERKLAVYWAAACWGDDLVAAVDAAAEEHFRRGAAGDWEEHLLHVPEPEASRKASR